MVLAVLGDSLTQGFPFGEKVSWVEVVKEKLNITVQNHGICGETTADMRRRLNSIITQEQLTHMLIWGGANDILLDRRPLEYILQDIFAMQEACLQNNLKTGCILPLLPAVDYCAHDFKELRKAIKEKSNCKIFVIDFQTAFKKEKNHVNYLSDGVHLTIEGNDMLGNYASQILKDWFE